MDVSVRIEQLRDDYLRRADTVRGMLQEAKDEMDKEGVDNFSKIHRLEIREFLYLEFAREIKRAL